MRRVPDEWNLAALRVLKQEPVREVALFPSFVCVPLARLFARVVRVVRARVSHDTVSGLILTAHQRQQVRVKMDAHRHFLHALRALSQTSS
jgi:hypothetical protein